MDPGAKGVAGGVYPARTRAVGVFNGPSHTIDFWSAEAAGLPRNRGFLYSLLLVSMRKTAALHISRVSSKGQITLPKKVRAAIGVHPGESVAYDVVGDVVTLRRIAPLDVAFHASLERTLGEWVSPEDDEAFRDL